MYSRVLSLRVICVDLQHAGFKWRRGKFKKQTNIKMNRFLRPISASIDALCNVKHRTNLGYKREKNPSIYKSTFKVSVRQISSVNKFGENDRDSLYDRFSILGFLAPIFAFSITKLVAGENEQDEDDSTWHKDNLKRNKTGKFSRTSSVSTFQKMKCIRSAKRQLEFQDKTDEESEICLTRKRTVSKTILVYIPRS